MRRASGEDLPVQIAQALSVIFSALLFFFEIRHALNGGDPYARSSGLIEQGLFATTSLGFSLALTRIDTMRASQVFRVASLVFGVISALGSTRIPISAARQSRVGGSSMRSSSVTVCRPYSPSLWHGWRAACGRSGSSSARGSRRLF
jgi:hypothetical protein